MAISGTLIRYTVHSVEIHKGGGVFSLFPPLDFVFASRLSCIVSTENKNNMDALHTACDHRRNQLLSFLGSTYMLDMGVCAEVKIGSEHLRLFSEQNAQGVQASVYNVNAKNWIAPSESVETIEQGKLKAVTYAEAYLKQAGNLELPSLKWKEARAA
jgi:hypothetical protein